MTTPGGHRFRLKAEALKPATTQIQTRHGWLVCGAIHSPTTNTRVQGDGGGDGDGDGFFRHDMRGVKLPP